MKTKTVILVLLSSVAIVGCSTPSATSTNTPSVQVGSDVGEDETSVSENKVYDYPEVTEETFFAYNLSVPSDLNFCVYEISYADLVEMYGKQKGVVFFGADWCPSCQKFAPYLFQVCQDCGIDLFYLNNSKYPRTEWEIDKETHQPVIAEYSEDYEKALDVLGRNSLPSYNIYDEQGTQYSTGSQRIWLPSLFKLNLDTYEQYSGPAWALSEDKQLSAQDEIIAISDLKSFISER